MYSLAEALASLQELTLLYRSIRDPRIAFILLAFIANYPLLYVELCCGSDWLSLGADRDTSAAKFVKTKTSSWLTYPRCHNVGGGYDIGLALLYD